MPGAGLSAGRMLPAMRRRALGGLLAILLPLAACQSGDSGPAATTPTLAPPTTTTTTQVTTTTGTITPTTTTTRPPGPNEVVIGDDQEPPTLNPYAPGGDNWIVSRIGQAIFAGLTEVDGDTGAIIPDLAAALPTVANGGVAVDSDGTTRVTFEIREEAVWENGTPITGDDVAFTYEALMAADPGTLGVDRTPYEAITDVEAHGKSGHSHLRRPHPGLRDDVPGDPPPAPDGGHRPRHRLEH